VYIVFTFYVAHKQWGKGGLGGAEQLVWVGLKKLLHFLARRKLVDLHEEKQFWGKGLNCLL
jgi:hypothetical protein